MVVFFINKLKVTIAISIWVWYYVYMKIIFASNNRKKIEQVKKYFYFADVVGLKEYDINIDVEETGKTFKENALLKARAIHKLTNEIVISDDSGLCINEYDGWPGVYTHRFLGDNSTETERNDYILEKMKDLPRERRGASVVCAIALVYDDKELIFEESYDSFITTQKLGNNNFGFDEIVEAPNHKDSIACLSDEEKLKINARSMALSKTAEYLKGQFNFD